MLFSPLSIASYSCCLLFYIQNILSIGNKLTRREHKIRNECQVRVPNVSFFPPMLTGNSKLIRLCEKRFHSRDIVWLSIMRARRDRINPMRFRAVTGLSLEREEVGFDDFWFEHVIIFQELTLDLEKDQLRAFPFSFVK